MKSNTYKPNNYNSVSPYLIVNSAASTIRFLETVFSTVVLRQFPDKDGRLMHAEARIDDSVLMLADSAPDWSPVESYVHVYVQDVDATYQAALATGASAIQESKQSEDEDKRGGVRDSGGTP